MAGRRPKGTGSITQRKDGRWQGTLELEHGAGKRPRHFVYGQTRREVQGKLAAATRQQARGEALHSARQPAAQFLETWLQDVVTIERPLSTLKQYRGHVSRYLLPALGHKALGEVTARDLQALYGQQIQRGLAPATVRLTHAVAHAAFSYAEEQDLIPRNPADRAHAPQAKPPPRPTLTAAQARYLLRSVQGDPLEAFWWLALTTGLRLGELLGLEWSAVDLGASLLHVRTSKTPRGRRQIPLCAPTRHRLVAHWERQRADWATRGSESPSWLFPNDSGVPWSYFTIRTHRWYPLLDRLALPRVHIHDLRHTVATLLLGMGIHPSIVQAILGHASIKMTLDTYSHVSPSMGRDAMEQLGTLLDEPLDVGLAVNREEAP